jgi:hypothetical protein
MRQTTAIVALALFVAWSVCSPVSLATDGPATAKKHVLTTVSPNSCADVYQQQGSCLRASIEDEGLPDSIEDPDGQRA